MRLNQQLSPLAWQSCDCKDGWTLLHIRSRRGVAEALSTLVALPVFLIFAGFLLYFGRLLYIKAAVEDAAAAGARWATTSLTGAQGFTQAREAMQLVFNGYVKVLVPVLTLCACTAAQPD
jgi:Flp pilus assembly protein TadG